MVPNALKRSQIVLDSPEQSLIVQNGPMNCCEWYPMVVSSPEQSPTFPNGLKWSQTVLNSGTVRHMYCVVWCGVVYIFIHFQWCEVYCREVRCREVES